MELYLLRHAIAVPRKGPHDRDRPLTKEGLRRIRRIAKGMGVLRIAPDAILSSSFRRARETADIVAAQLRCEAPELTPHLEPGGNPGRMVALLRKRLHAARCVVLVGHEPALSSLASTLLTGGDAMRMEMKKGGLCKLRIDRLRYGRCATLQWLLTPRQLMRLE
jgi:phosphohistidine phosphatase